ncbi:heparinase II/III family protein [Planktotalea sp.]|uniref:heparinase II/III family protein n=1 Tax=Planktotalea sp. TaxID=2029877 RepID=UPI0025E74D96|nr:heparinase II/III family protein [Planktotalea sp.]
MSTDSKWSARATRAMHRVQARLVTRQTAATGFVSQPEPRTIGSFAKGRQLAAGNIMFSGHLVEAPGTSLWKVTPPDAAFADEAHGFSWLDDLAAVGDSSARIAAQTWVLDWIDSYGRGKGPGWVPGLTGRRLIRWINHALFLLRGQDAEASEKFYRSLTQQTTFLAKRWHKTEPGLARFEALTGMIYAGLSLSGMEAHVTPAVKALARACSDEIDAEGGISTRNPEELLDIFMLITWAAVSLREAGIIPPQDHLDAIERIAPTLRSLRHADGSLARFYGGGRGVDGRLDQALSNSEVRRGEADGLSMGFARMSGGRTSLVMDASIPPKGVALHNAHASTLAFELTSGRRPLIVNCGLGKVFGEDWRSAGRATQSHSVLSIDGYSSARFAASGTKKRKLELLVENPKHVPFQVSEAPDGVRIQAGHDGYDMTYGLTQARTLELTFNGRGLAGEDMLLALEDVSKKRFDKRMDELSLQGVAFSIRFHLHPEVDAALDMGETAVSMAQKSGELWVFRHDGVAKLSLEPSVYLEKGRLQPRATKQIVLTGRAMDYATRIRWSLSKTQDTAVGVRDLVPDDDMQFSNSGS